MILSRRSVIKSLQSKRQSYLLPPRLSLFSSSTPKLTVHSKFDEILSFHDGVAAVRETNEGGAYHIDRNGDPLYRDDRYKRTFGFYAAHRAAVVDFDDTFLHIDMSGRPVYQDRYSWCGNFHNVSPDKGVFRSPVRDSNNHYYYIDHEGRKTLGPFSYAGDPNSAGYSVVHDLDGNPSIIGIDGRDWCSSKSKTERKWIELLVPHKGIALAKDEAGWFYMHQSGQEAGGGERYLFAEPHYNGQARVRFQNGQWGVIDEAGKMVVSLGESILSSAVELENISKGYWESLALKKILENNVLQHEHKHPNKTPSPALATYREILRDCSVEMGLLRRQGPSEAFGNPSSLLLNRGILLADSSHDEGTDDASYKFTGDRCRYWLQDRYLQSWLDCPQEYLIRDTFSEIAADPKSVELSQRILKSYADSDWTGAGAVLSKLLDGQNKNRRKPNKSSGTKNIRTVVDMGGGHGSLLRELQHSGLLENAEEFICIDRPEVIDATLSSQGLASSSSTKSNLDAKQQINTDSIIKHEVGDLFGGPLPNADLYLMSRVLHDWPDPQVTDILERLHLLSPEDARLCVIDRASTPDKLHALLSLHMYALQGSRERSDEHWQELFSSSGWQIDGREHLNGHEMYMLTKMVTASMPAATFQPSKSFHVRAPDLVDKATVTPTVRKAVITAGGQGTRMNPQSFVTPKALLPILSRGHLLDDKYLQPLEWEVRPALSYILDQFYDTSHNVDQVYVVCNPKQIPLMESFLQHYRRQQHATGEKELSLQLVTQHSERGFGDSVLAARHVIGDEPFMLALGDHIFSADCVKKILTAYHELSSSPDFRDWRKTVLTGATLCDESEVKDTGLLRNQEAAYQVGRPWLVHEMVEKPTSNYQSFQISNDGLVKYPSQLGIDVLPPSIFTLLQAEKDQIAPGEEVDLRKVLQESLQGNRQLFGSLIDGKRLDIGNPKAYFSSLQVIGNDDAAVYHSPVRSSTEVRELEQQDEILEMVRTLQSENSSHLPATLRQALFCRSDSSCSSSGKLHISSCPGRMDLMCGIADHSGSLAIQHLTAERVVSLAVADDSTNLQVGRERQGTIRLACIQVAKLSELPQAVATRDFQVRETSFPTKELFTSAGGLKCDTDLRTTLSEKFGTGEVSSRWAMYLTGIIHRMYQEFAKETNSRGEKNVTVVTVSDLPWNAGLASSAAVEIATAISLGKAFQLPPGILQPVPISMLCKEVENGIVGAPCGILDHLAVTHPGASNRITGHPLVGVRCRISTAEAPTYSLPLPEGLSVIALESGVKRSTGSSAYQSVRISAIIGKAILEAARGEEFKYLCDMTPSQFAKYEAQLPETMSSDEIQVRFPSLLAQEDSAIKESTSIFPVRAATRFPIEENHRVQIFKTYSEPWTIAPFSGNRVSGC